MGQSFERLRVAVGDLGEVGVDEHDLVGLKRLGGGATRFLGLSSAASPKSSLHIVIVV